MALARWSGRLLLDAAAEAVLNITLFFLRFFAWVAQWSIAMVVFLLVMAGAGYFVFLRAVAPGDYVTTPNVVNMPVSDAYTLLVKSGLQLGDQEEMLNESVPRNYVIAQRLPAGKVVRKGRKVSLTVSVGSDLEQAPNLVGQIRADAEAALARTGRFQIASPPTYIPHPSPRDMIIGQDPPPGKRIPRGTLVSVLLSSGAGGLTIPVPDVQGMPVQEATNAILRVGLDPVLIRVTQPKDAPADQVLEQEPAPGAVVAQGETVRIKARTTASTPDTWREIQLTYVVPKSFYDREVRIVVINKEGAPWTLFPQKQHYENNMPPLFRGGQEVTVSFAFQEQATIEIYLDGEKVQTRFFEGDADPVIREFETDTEGDRRA